MIEGIKGIRGECVSYGMMGLWVCTGKFAGLNSKL